MRLKILVLFFLLGCTDDMQFTQQGIICSKISTAIEIELIWVIGDSHATKRNVGGPGPTPTDNTVYQWDPALSNLFEITNTDIKQAGSADTGWSSIFPQYGIDRHTDTDRMIVFVTSGIGGSNYSPRTGDTGDWTDADTLWSTASTDYDNALAYLQANYPGSTIYPKVKVILGVNDVRGATALSTIQTDITAFYDRFDTDYPGMEIGIVLPGRSETGVSLARHSSVRSYLINEARTRSNVYISCTEAHYYAAGLYNVDDLHLSEAGNNALGSMLARWDRNSSYDEWARAIIASHFTEPSSAQKTLINNFRTTIGDDYFDLEYLHIFKTTDSDDIYNSWILRTACNDVSTGFTHTTNSHMTTNGTSSYFLLGHVAPNNNVVATSSDFFDGVKIKTNRSAAGSLRVALGVGNSPLTSQIAIGQLATSQVYVRANDVTTTSYATDTKLQDDTFYAAYRDAGTKGLWKNSASVVSASVAAASGITRNKPVGCLDNDGTFQNYIDADFEYAVGGQKTTVDLAALYSALETLIDGW